MRTAIGSRAVLARALCRMCLAMAAAALAGLLAAAADAQESVHAAGSAGTRDAAGWDLPRIFYDARQRRKFDAQDRALRLGLRAEGAAATGPRFDGWLSGPAGTHAWVSGTRYVADRAGRLRAAEEHGETSGDTLANGSARLDRAAGVLVVRRETEGTLHLRVGEADNLLDTTAPTLAVPAAH